MALGLTATKEKKRPEEYKNKAPELNIGAKVSHKDTKTRRNTKKKGNVKSAA